jgi:hypothetical protein
MKTLRTARNPIALPIAPVVGVLSFAMSFVTLLGCAF